jgi:LAGLIDADG endonuclease
LIIFSYNINSLFLILFTKVKNNFINRGLSSIVNPVSTESKNSLSPQVQPHWVTGFTDAEGSFIISVYKRSDSNNWQIKPSFELGLHSKDISILHELKIFFGVGIINTRVSQNFTSFTVTKLSDLVNVIIPHFSNFPLQTQKRVDFLLWSKIVESKKK